MGLFGFAFDLIVISSGAAGVRRLTGYSLKEFSLKHVKNPQVQTALKAYFGMGEAVVGAGLKYAAYIKATKESKDQKRIEDKD